MIVFRNLIINLLKVSKEEEEEVNNIPGKCCDRLNTQTTLIITMSQTLKAFYNFKNISFTSSPYSVKA